MAIVFAVSIPSFAEDNSSQDFTFTKSDLGVVITGYTNKDIQELLIPDSIENQPVIGIKSGAFSDLIDLTEFKVSDDNTYFTVIDGVLYKREPVLTLIAFPPNYSAYEFSTLSETNIIGEYAFMNCKNINIIHLSEYTGEIGDFAFCGSKGLWLLDFANEEIKIGDNVFKECENQISRSGCYIRDLELQ
jgi:hypothetical protein